MYVIAAANGGSSDITSFDWFPAYNEYFKAIYIGYARAVIGLLFALSVAVVAIFPLSTCCKKVTDEEATGLDESAEKSDTQTPQTETVQGVTQGAVIGVAANSRA